MRRKVLFASSGVGLGHVVRDVYLCKYMDWADITWVTSGRAIRYVLDNGFKLHEVSYAMNDLSPIIEGMVINGKLRITLDRLRELYDIIKRNSRLLGEYLDLADFDCVIADEFWELLFMDEVGTKTIFITDFLKFKPQRTSILQRILIPYINKSLYNRLHKFDCRIYIGLKPPLDGGFFEFYGQLFTHSIKHGNLCEGDQVLINLGGTDVGTISLNIIIPVLDKIGLPVRVIGSGNFYTSNPLEHIIQSKIIITLAGYSSLIELSRFRKRGVIMPIGDDFEQLDNAELFMGREGYRVMPLNKINPNIFSRILLEIFDEAPDPPAFKDAANIISSRIKIIIEN